MDFLDLTKGVLVLLMVVYHAFNCSTAYYLGFRYLSFLPASFIFITGFLLALVYQPRLGKPRTGVSRRLVIRAVKLIGLFTLLNLGARVVALHHGDRWNSAVDFFYDSSDIYVFGLPHAAVFDVLLPIGYLLLISPLLLVLFRKHLAGARVVTVGLVVLIAVLDARNFPTGHLDLVAIGVLGTFFGHFPQLRFDVFRKGWVACLIAYVIYFPVGVRFGFYFPVQVIGAVVAVAMLFGVTARFGSSAWWQRPIIQLGQYSLISYILQIGFLQVAMRFAGRPVPGSLPFYLFVVATVIFLVAAVAAIDRARRNVAAVDRSYRFVFA